MSRSHDYDPRAEGYLDYYDIKSAFRSSSLEPNGRLNLPYGEDPVWRKGDGPDAEPQREITQEMWETSRWNPAHGSILHANSPPDPSASDKPTWQQLVDEELTYRIQLESSGRDGTLEWFGRLRDAAAGELVAESRGENADHGISHMASLAFVAEHANAAGHVLPIVRVRDLEHSPLVKWTSGDVRELVGTAARAKNRVENAHNKIIKEFRDIRGEKEYVRRLQGGESRTLSERYDAMLASKKWSMNYQAKLAAEMAKDESDMLPSDLPTLQAVLIERLESAATGHQKHVKGALTQQAIDNWAACVDMDSALTEIARRCVLGIIEIEAAADDIWKRTAGTWALVTDVGSLPASEEHEGDDPPAASLGSDGEHYRQLTGIGEAKAAFAAAKQSIESVSAANIPTWAATQHASPNTIEYTNGDVGKFSGATKAIVDCKQVSGVEGKVSQRIPRARYDDGSPSPLTMLTLKRPSGHPTWHSAVVELAAEETKPVTVTFTGRNICGSSQFKLTLTP